MNVVAAVSDVADTAVLVGGPVDGREHPVDAGTRELLVVMTDGAQHSYVRSGMVKALPDGRTVPVFDYRGRHYPLRPSVGN